MEIMKSLIIHIGTAKTGTTALQKYLSDNNELLKKRGWYYMEWENTDVSDDIKTECNRGCVNGAIPAAASYGFWSEEQQNTVWRELKEKLQMYNVILSEECIWDNTVIKTEEIIQYFKSHYSDIKIIVYLRRQDMYGESLWNQGVKEYLESKTVMEHIASNENLQYLNKLEKIEAIIGKENLIVRVYEKGQLGGEGSEVCTDFLDALGMGQLEDSIPPQKLNLRLEGDLLEIKRCFNEVYKMNGGGRAEYYFEEEFCKVNKEFETGDSGKSFLSGKEQIDMMRMFKPDNEVIARKYLGRDNGELFRDNSIRDTYLSCITKREKTLVELFARIAASQSRDWGKRIELVSKEKERLNAEVGLVSKEKERLDVEKELASKEKERLIAEVEFVLKEKERLNMEVQFVTKEKEYLNAEVKKLREIIRALEAKLEHRTVKGAFKFILRRITNLF